DYYCSSYTAGNTWVF
nr:immunoglobulin light chain junction region [Macaca mulatta]